MNDESKLTLHGLVQHYTMLSEEGKNKRLMDLLDQLDFNQVRLLRLVAHAEQATSNQCDFRHKLTKCGGICNWHKWQQHMIGGKQGLTRFTVCLLKPTSSSCTS